MNALGYNHRFGTVMSRDLPNIYLIGPLGAGKSSVGRALAKITRHTFIDTDDEIIRRSGVDLSWIYEVEGEPGYRKREQALIAEYCQKKNILLSTGGGAVLVKESRQAMSRSGYVIYLEVSFILQYERTLRRRNTRPVLEDGGSFKENLRSLNSERQALYKEIADVTYLTDRIRAQKIARKILQWVKEQSEN
jgi:shikimate kinase